MGGENDRVVTATVASLDGRAFGLSPVIEAINDALMGPERRPVTRRNVPASVRITLRCQPPDSLLGQLPPIREPLVLVLDEGDTRTVVPHAYLTGLDDRGHYVEYRFDVDPFSSGRRDEYHFDVVPLNRSG